MALKQYNQHMITHSTHVCANGGTTLSTTIRLRVREEAEARGMNISTLSIAANIDYQTAQRMWHNQARRIDIETLVKIAAAFKIHAKDLIEEVEES